MKHVFRSAQHIVDILCSIQKATHADDEAAKALLALTKQEVCSASAIAEKVLDLALSPTLPDHQELKKAIEQTAIMACAMFAREEFAGAPHDRRQKAMLTLLLAYLDGRDMTEAAVKALHALDLTSYTSMIYDGDREGYTIALPTPEGMAYIDIQRRCDIDDERIHYVGKLSGYGQVCLAPETTFVGEVSLRSWMEMHIRKKPISKAA